MQKKQSVQIILRGLVSMLCNMVKNIKNKRANILQFCILTNMVDKILLHVLHLRNGLNN